jgi:hypothetical protein
MEDIITTQDIRKFFLGKKIFQKCSSGLRTTTSELVSRVGLLRLRDPLFQNITLQDLERLCDLKSSEDPEQAMDIEEENVQDEKYNLGSLRPLRPFNPFSDVRLRTDVDSDIEEDPEIMADRIGPPPPLMRYNRHQ